MAEVVLKEVTKKFGNFVAVNRVSLEIQDGEFVVLVGPSGCGKTTTLRMIAGLEEVTEGEIYIGGRLVNDVPPKDPISPWFFKTTPFTPTWMCTTTWLSV